MVLKLLSALRHLKHFLLPKMVAVHFFLLDLLSVQILLSLLMHEPLNVLLLLIMLLLLMLKSELIKMLLLMHTKLMLPILFLLIVSTCLLGKHSRFRVRASIGARSSSGGNDVSSQ